MINILVTGSKGQLGNEIMDMEFEFPDMSFSMTDINELDITNKDDLYNYFSGSKFDYIINCAAYTAVDKAEEDKDLAYRVNAEAPKYLAEIAQKLGIKLIHISTDYVFNGTDSNPYKEDEPTCPNSIYGKSKLEGELAIKKSNADAIIIRTSWLYSSYGNNFVKTMMRLGEERTNLDVVFDQIGTPTYAHDLALTILKIVRLTKNDEIINKVKTYHFSNEGVCSWYDFAIKIMNIANIDCKINPIETKDYPTPATRPQYSVLNKSKIKKDFNIVIPFWKDSLRACIDKIR